MDAFKRALEIIQTRVSVSAPDRCQDASNRGTTATRPASVPRLAIAYSGGLDSAALLHVARDYAGAAGIKLFAFHVHHGLSANADSWLLHCENYCAALGIAFDARRVVLADQSRDGIEKAARTSRYRALGDLCRLHAVPLLLTAHHQDDQAETVMLQLLRGSGVAGLGGMEIANTAAELLGDPSLVIGRPFLSVSRADLEDAVADLDIRYVDDESNADVRFARNALRHTVMPSLSSAFPNYQERVARAAQHARSAQRLLNEFAAQDLSACLEGECINIERLKSLNSDRIDNVLRFWFASHNVRMPATAWLEEVREQLFTAREDAQVRVIHADCEIRRHRNRIALTPRRDDALLAVPAERFRWCGESRMHFAAYGGSLLFEEADEGVSVDWLQSQELQLHYRAGGEKLKLGKNRPTRSLKHHYQALDVPAWERQRLPLVSTPDQLVFAAGIGMNWLDLPVSTGAVVRLRWSPDTM